MENIIQLTKGECHCRQERGGFCTENNNNGTMVASGDRKYVVRISTQTSLHLPNSLYRSVVKSPFFACAMLVKLLSYKTALRNNKYYFFDLVIHFPPKKLFVLIFYIKVNKGFI